MADLATKLRYRDALLEKQRRLARTNLIAYTQYVKPNYIVEDFHRRVAEALMAVERGELRRLMITAPPRHGKTELVSKTFPLWYLGRQALRGSPPRHVMHCGYGGTITDDAGEALRNLAKNELHQDIFPDIRIAVDAGARNRWHTDRGDIYIAAGVGGPITGRGFTLGIIDDAVKGHEDADSEVMQEKTWRWYLSDFFSRREMPNAIVCIGTRWNEADLMGNLIRRMDEGGDQWHHIHFAALSDKDEPLCPSRMSAEELRLTRAESGDRIWQALYQGNPTPDEGLFFKAEWFWEYDDNDLMFESSERDAHGEPIMKARAMRYYGASDYAVSDGEGDYTVHVVVGVDQMDHIYLVDLWREQATSDVWVERMLDMAEQWEPIGWAEEKGQIEKGVGPFISKRQQERRIFFSRHGFTSAADKRTRAQTIRARMSMGMVRFPRNAPWYPTLKSEMLKFDAGKNDDQVDALSLIGRMLAGMAKGRVPAVPGPAAVVGIQTDDSGHMQVPVGMRPATLDELWANEERRKSRKRRRRR